jgi:hypothetical protein
MSSSEVDAWLASSRNPKRDVMAAVRRIIMSDVRIDETIKYRAPAFQHNGIMAYFHWNARDFASLIFPRGSRIPGDFELLDSIGLQRVVRFETVGEVKAHRAQLLDIVDAWCSISKTQPSRSRIKPL